MQCILDFELPQEQDLASSVLQEDHRKTRGMGSSVKSGQNGESYLALPES